MTLPRVIACLILFPILMFGIVSTLRFALDGYGFFGLAVAWLSIFGFMYVTGKWMGADFS